MPSILVVDHWKEDREQLATMLESRGYFVVQLDNGEDTVKLLECQLFDLIFMGVILPGINGFQATRLIKHMPGREQIPIVIYKTTMHPTDIRWAYDQGAVGTLSKPLSKPYQYQSRDVFQFTKELDIIKFKEELDEKLPAKTTDVISRTKI